MSATAPDDASEDDLLDRDAYAADVEDAYVDGDRTYTPGTARSAFQHRTFRTIYLGAFASNIGTWMQNVVLGALAWQLTHSEVFVGVMIAAQLGPLLVFSVVGGMLADNFDRKKVLVVLSIQQAVFSIVLAAVTAPDDPNRVAMVLTVLCIGIGNALYAPIFSAVVPILVPRRDIAGAISLTLGNPKIMVFYLALLPSIIDLSSVTLFGLAELVLVALAVMAGVDLAWAFAAAWARRWFRSSRAVRIANRSSATAMGGAAVLIATR